MGIGGIFLDKILGVITGTGFYKYPQLREARWKIIDTPYGNQQVFLGKINDMVIAWIPRHGLEEEKISSRANPRSIIYAMKEIGVSWLVGFSVVGVIDEAIPLAHPILFDDLFFITNMLPDGTVCTFFTPESKKRGHFVFEKPVSKGLSKVLIHASKEAKIEIIEGGVMAQTMGPRLETSTEVKFLKMIGASAVSLTGGHEMILAGEMEIPYVLVGFGINYATGVLPWMTASDEMAENLKEIPAIIQRMINALTLSPYLKQVKFDTGYILK